MTSELEANIVSIERINEYIDIIPEAEWKTESVIPNNWPSHGAIEFINYSMTYKTDGDPILKNLSFKVLPKQKVCI